LDNEAIKPKKKVYMVLNKPVGVTCTLSRDVENNIINFMNYPDYVFPVGRLDKESQGLILMTNDGDLGNKILESDNHYEKEYIVTVHKSFEDTFLDKMGEGVEILGVKTRPCIVKRISADTFSIILTQGLNRQIRRMTKVFGYEVIRLERIRIMNVSLDDLQIGKWRNLTEKEVSELRSYN